MADRFCVADADLYRRYCRMKACGMVYYLRIVKANSEQVRKS